MSSLINSLGLGGSLSSTTKVPCLAPYYVIFNFVFAHAAISSRPLKNAYKLDHNVNPREDVTKYGEKAVQDGKITRQQLNRLKRLEAAHANAVENFPMFVGAALLAVQARVPNETVNTVSLVYTVVRIFYAVAYVAIDNVQLSYIRSLLWWAGNWCCFYLLWQSGKILNAGL